jgi:tetratricopeptide (TPR) repeat protein
MLVLQSAIELNKENHRACYYLGNLFYDKKQFDKAITIWETSRDLNPGFPTVHRNLALAYFNKLDKKEAAKIELEKAFELNSEDARVLFELDQLYKKLNVSHFDRLRFLKENIKLVKDRDDLYVEYVTLMNNVRNYEEARALIAARKFHPWEGGEGRVISQYVLCHLELAKKAISEKEFAKAIELLEEAKVYPDNLGEGKLTGAQENNLDYYLGIAYEALDKSDEAYSYFTSASKGLDVPASAMFYNDQPADTIFYQGLALMKIGREAEALGRFNKLYDYGEKHLFDDVKIDYFAVSLPDFLVFDEELNKKNLVHCRYLMGLGSLGLSNLEKAEKNLKTAGEMDINHQGVKIHLEMLEKRGNI